MTNFYNNYNTRPVFVPFFVRQNQGTKSLPVINQGPARDTFVNNQASNVFACQIARPAGVFDNKRIEDIYNRTYNTVMAQNPIVNELNLTKPKLNFYPDNSTNERTLLSYMGGVNEIKVQDKDFFTDKCYLCMINDKNGEVVDVQVLTQQKADNYLKKHPNCTLTKTELNDSEKELYISSLLAHELRHCIQAHLLSSTKGCMDEYKGRFIEYEKSLRQMVELKKELAKMEGRAYIPSCEDEELNKLGYGLNYVPKKIFDENILFKYSILPSDNRYWSVKNHFLPAGKKIQGGEKEYYGSPLEIDASNYELEFFITEAAKYPKWALRDVILKGVGLSISLCKFDSNFPFIIYNPPLSA